MKLSARGLELIKEFEGLRLNPYLDSANIATIGYGNTYYDNGAPVQITDSPITEKRATKLLKVITKDFESGVNELVTRCINQNQFDALVSFAYNVGLKALENSTLLKKVNANPCDRTIDYEFSRWNKAGGKVLNGLIKRREKEANLYFE